MYEEEEKINSEKISLSVWKKVFKIAFKSKKDIIGLGICLVVLGVLDIANPYISSKAIEVFFGDNPDFSKTWLFIGIYVLIALLYGIVIYYFVKIAGIILSNSSPTNFLYFS